MAKEKSLIAYCGLYCEECFGYQGKIADLARDLRKVLRQCRFDKTAEVLGALPFFKEFKDYPQSYAVLGAMVKLRCKKACRGGGGSPVCAIRKCGQKKNIDGCWLCDDFKTCTKLDFLKANHGDAHLKNLRKLNQKGVNEFLAGKKYWYTPLKK